MEEGDRVLALRLLLEELHLFDEGVQLSLELGWIEGVRCQKTIQRPIG